MNHKFSTFLSCFLPSILSHFSFFTLLWFHNCHVINFLPWSYLSSGITAQLKTVLIHFHLICNQTYEQTGVTGVEAEHSGMAEVEHCCGGVLHLLQSRHHSSFLRFYREGILGLAVTPTLHNSIKDIKPIGFLSLLKLGLYYSGSLLHFSQGYLLKSSVHIFPS